MGVSIREWTEIIRRRFSGSSEERTRMLGSLKSLLPLAGCFDSVELIRDDDVLYCSTGPDFIGELIIAQDGH